MACDSRKGLVGNAKKSICAISFASPRTLLCLSAKKRIVVPVSLAGIF